MKIEPCPRCGAECRLTDNGAIDGAFPFPQSYWIECKHCIYTSRGYRKMETAIRKHNANAKEAKRGTD